MRCQRSGYDRWGVVLLVCLLGLGDIVLGQGGSTWNPVTTACNIEIARGVILGDSMYLDGGFITHEQYFESGIRLYNFTGVAPWRWQNQHLWELDLSSKFNVSTPKWTAHPKPDDWNQQFNGGASTLWDIGDGKFYTLGGWLAPYIGPKGQKLGEPYFTHDSEFHFQLPETRIFAYDPKTKNWSSELHKDIHRLSDTAYAQSVRNKVGYAFGGLSVKEVDSSPTEFTPWMFNSWTPTDTMLKYDFRTQEYNITSLPDYISGRAWAVMHSLDRVGSEGVLVAFGGDSNPFTDMRPMDEILLYDIGSSTWMKQTATGDIPPARRNTCSILIPAPDLSSYQIYMFSGISTEVRLLDLYVLSIPAFSWVKVGIKGYPNQYGIADMTCALYEERQFIIVPGVTNVTDLNKTATDVAFWTECNKGTKVHVFDTYDWEFKPEFDPDNKGPKVPPSIVELVGGNETGGATLNQPKAGWENSDLGDIFSTRNQLLQDPPSQSPSPPNAPGGSTSNKGAILGGVIGGICVLAVSILIIMFFWKCKKSGQADFQAELEGPPSRAELRGAHLRVELQGAELRAELQGAELRAEVQGNYNHRGPYNTPHTYEPQDMTSAAGGHDIPVQPEGDSSC